MESANVKVDEYVENNEVEWKKESGHLKKNHIYQWRCTLHLT